jgi:tetratricopeptide (TPR) repeat protein
VTVAEAIDLARRLLDEGKLEEALQTLLQSAETENDSDLDLEIALLYTERGLSKPDDEAMKDFAEAETWSELPLTMAAKGAVLVRRGTLGEAEALFARALESDAGMPEALLGMARVRLAQGQVDAAGELATSVVQSSPRSGDAWQFLAEVLEKIGRKDDAIKALEEGLKYDMGNPRLLTALGFRLEDPQAAIRALRRAVDLDPDNAEAWRGLALADARSGNEIGMHESLNRALALDPEGTKTWLEEVGKTQPLLGAVAE